MKGLRKVMRWMGLVLAGLWLPISLPAAGADDLAAGTAERPIEQDFQPCSEVSTNTK